MTDRKPADMTFTSWIDKQIAEATERGAFDNLPGAGKPIPHHGNEDAAEAWLRQYLRKEGVSAEALLPPPLRLRKAIDRLSQAVPAMASERDVRDAVAYLNHEIREWRRIPLGPPIFVPLVDEEAMVSRWHAAQPRSATPAKAQPEETAETAAAAGRSRPRRWRRPAAFAHRLPSAFAVREHGRMDDNAASLRAENAELRRLLEKHQWAGLTPFKSTGCCPECSGPAPPRGSGHRPGCAIAAILALSTPLPTDL